MRLIFSTDEITDKRDRNNITRSTGAKKMLDVSALPEKQKPQIHEKQVDKNKPRLGRVEQE